MNKETLPDNCKKSFHDHITPASLHESETLFFVRKQRTSFFEKHTVSYDQRPFYMVNRFLRATLSQYRTPCSVYTETVQYAYPAILL